ncbi:MAG: hypothetical protein QOD37_2510 [Gaiellales bacterium]|nr:hypothetical protein [Gaiellales bacterium]
MERAPPRADRQVPRRYPWGTTCPTHTDVPRTHGPLGADLPPVRGLDGEAARPPGQRSSLSTAAPGAMRGPFDVRRPRWRALAATVALTFGSLALPAAALADGLIDPTSMPPATPSAPSSRAGQSPSDGHRARRSSATTSTDPWTPSFGSGSVAQRQITGTPNGSPRTSGTTAMTLDPTAAPSSSPASAARSRCLSRAPPPPAGGLAAARRPGPSHARLQSRCGPVAQLVEQGTFNPKVAGSSPARPIR